MLHSNVGKERGQVQTKQIFFIIQHISYVQKEEKWFRTLQTQNVNKSMGRYIYLK